MNKGFIKFCPDVGGPCVGEACGAHVIGMRLQLLSNGQILNQILMNDPMEEDDKIPLSLLVSCSICSKYDKFIDKESSELFHDILKDLSEET